MKKPSRIYKIVKNFEHKNVFIKDQCHITGKWRGSMHEERSLNCKFPAKVPLLFIKKAMMETF